MIELWIENLPEIIFAHRYRCSGGAWRLFQNPDIIEITLCLSGSMIKSWGNCRQEFCTGDFIITRHDNPYLIEASNSHEHATVAFHRGRLTQLPTGLRAFLPDFVPSSSCQDARKALLSLVGLPLNSLAARVKIMDIISELDRLERVCEKVDNPHYTKALAYIQANLSCDISLTGTAQYLGISGGYLGSLFRANGTTFTEHVNSTRIACLQQLLCAKNITARQAGLQVGIGDPKYLSRLFHRYCGISIRQFIAEAGKNSPTE